jgi:hypothetical protein
MPSTEVDRRDGTEAFQVSRQPGLAPAGELAATLPANATPLERLRAGEIDRDGYLDLKVDDATAHLSGLHPEELDAVKTVLRGQLASDPALVELVRQATDSARST